MDQLRKAGDWLKRHHFWVLTVIAVLVALFCWWRGANALYAEFKTNKSKIESEFNAANSVRSKPFHPNADVRAGQTEQIVNQQKSVHQLWKDLYERQTASVLKWPENLSEEFRSYVNKLKFGENIPRNLRAQYNNYILDHFPKLPKIVGALEMGEGGSGGMGGMGRGSGGSMNYQNLLENMRSSGGGPGGMREGGTEPMVEEQDFIVIWADQQTVRDELYPRTTPSVKRIWKTQEDLWVYEALLRIIANTNAEAGADRFSNAAVRVIESLEVGRTAAQASRGKGRIDIVESAGAADGMGAEMSGRGMEFDGGAGGPEGGGYPGEMHGEGLGRGGEMGGAAGDAELFNSRYVGADGAPIASTGEGGPDEFGKEFKRLPVRMQLLMDQRWLPQLITECANAPLQVEIQEVRINPSDSGAMGGGGYAGRGGGGRPGGGGEYGTSSAGSEEMMPEAEPNIKTVVLQGTVTIFNPPSEAETSAESVEAN